MKKTIIAFITLLAAAALIIFLWKNGNSGGSSAGTVSKRDTIYMVDVTDTLSATVMYKKDSASDRVYTLKGYALVRGFKTMVNNQPQWAEKPSIVGALDDKKQPLKHVIQVL